MWGFGGSVGWGGMSCGVGDRGSVINGKSEVLSE